MKNAEMSLKTKQALAASLKRAMQKKPLSKITVRELIEDCNINRKTFYYHFDDIYALLKWMLEQETVEVVKQFDLMVNSREAILFSLDYIENNKHILHCAYDAIGREGLKSFLYQDFFPIICSLLNDCEQQLGIAVEAEFKQFVAGFYVEAFAGTLINILQNRKPYDHEALAQDMVLIFKSSLPAILKDKSGR